MKITIDLGSGTLDAAAQRDIQAAVKRSLMPFDKLNRLVAKSGGKRTTEKLSAWEQLGQTLSSFAPKMVEIRDRMREAVKECTLLDDYFSDAPPKLELVGTGVTDLSRALIEISPASIQAVKAFYGLDQQTLYTAGLLDMVPISAFHASSGIKENFSDLGQWLEAYVAGPVAVACDGLFGNIESGAKVAWSNTKSVFSDTATYLKDTFSGAWQQVLQTFSDTDDTMAGFGNSIYESVKKAANRVISGINSAVLEPFAGLNAAMSKLAGFKIGNLEPFKNLSLHITAPRIPFLASGAVLPANKPFMAVVGDQKHGTNVEAPLSTIQEAVAAVMTDVVEAELAGHNATVGVLTQILEAVLGIHLDENAIGAAADRYNVRQRMITGGF